MRLMELEIERAPVSVSLIKPASINTPFPHHARNYTEQEPDVPPPVYHPDEVARAILHACAHAERDIYVGSGARIMSALGKHAPRRRLDRREYYGAPRIPRRTA